MVQQNAICQLVTDPQEIEHPGMTKAWFDDAVRRSFELDLRVVATRLPGLYFMESISQPGLIYHVSARSCGCAGHARLGQCYHRARAIFEDWSCTTEPPTPAAPHPKTTESAMVTIGYGRRCPWCGGDGRGYRALGNDRYAEIDCLNCQGTGWVDSGPRRIVGQVIGIPTMLEQPVCRACLGTRVIDRWLPARLAHRKGEACPRCGGSGVEPAAAA